LKNIYVRINSTIMARRVVKILEANLYNCAHFEEPSFKLNHTSYLGDAP
jgi:hypothetical protein